MKSPYSALPAVLAVALFPLGAQAADVAPAPRAKPAAARKAKPSPAAQEEAERRMARGAAGVKAASSPPDFKDAAAEFEAAALAVPGLADAHYNAGVAYARAGEHEEAARSLRRYIELAVGAKDLKEAKAKLAEEEFLLEKAAKAQSRLTGTWATASNGEVDMLLGKVHRQYKATASGGRYKLSFEKYTGDPVGSTETFEFTLDGAAANGTYHWSGQGPGGRQLCDAISSPLTSELSADGKTLHFKYTSRFFEKGCASYQEEASLMRIE